MLIRSGLDKLRIANACILSTSFEWDAFSLQIKSLHYFCYIATDIFSEQIRNWSNKMQNDKRSSSMTSSFSQSWSIHNTSERPNPRYLEAKIIGKIYEQKLWEKYSFWEQIPFIEIPQALCRMYESGRLNPPASCQQKSVSEYVLIFGMQITFEICFKCF